MAITVAISSGVASTVPIDRVRNWSVGAGRVWAMPIWWASLIRRACPTLVDRRTNAQFTEPAVASHRSIGPPSWGSEFTVNASLAGKIFGTEHGDVPSTMSAGE